MKEEYNSFQELLNDAILEGAAAYRIPLIKFVEETYAIIYREDCYSLMVTMEDNNNKYFCPYGWEFLEFEDTVLNDIKEVALQMGDKWYSEIKRVDKKPAKEYNKTIPFDMLEI